MAFHVRKCMAPEKKIQTWILWIALDSYNSNMSNCIKGQGRVYPVHVRVLPWYLSCFLGILGDYITHKYPRAIGLI